MAKEIKGNSRREPPEPAEYLEIEEWFGSLMPSVQPIVRRLDESIRAVFPDLEYAVKYKRAFYGLPEVGWIIELAPYAVSVNVLFFGGADLDPPPKMGSADRTRYVKVTSISEATEPALLVWMKQAARARGWR